MTEVLELDTAACIALPQSQTQTFQGRPHSRSEQLVATQSTWQDYYRQQLPAVNEPWWAHREVTTDRFSGTLWIDESLPFFQGHFPGHPILPGVAQINWAVTAVTQCFNDSPQHLFAGMSRIKFKTPVLPHTWLQLNLNRINGGFAFDYSDGDGARTQGHLHYHA